jgi:hypothetical protein
MGLKIGYAYLISIQTMGWKTMMAFPYPDRYGKRCLGADGNKISPR